MKLDEMLLVPMLKDAENEPHKLEPDPAACACRRWCLTSSFLVNPEFAGAAFSGWPMRKCRPLSMTVEKRPPISTGQDDSALPWSPT